MVEIKRVTPRYDALQDRIALTMEDAGKQVLLLWLTQRLANRLAGTLAGWLDEDVRVSASKEDLPRSPGHAPASNHSSERTGMQGMGESGLHAMEQWVARSRMKPSRPVDRTAAKSEALLSTIDLLRRDGVCTLTFRWGSQGAASLKLDKTRLRQWLIALYRQFKVAGWPKEVWPHWITEGEDAGGVSTLRKHDVN